MGEGRGLGLGSTWSDRLPCHGGAGDVTLFCDTRGTLVTWKPTAEAGGEERSGLGLVCQPDWAARSDLIGYLWTGEVALALLVLGLVGVFGKVRSGKASSGSFVFYFFFPWTYLLGLWYFCVFIK